MYCHSLKIIKNLKFFLELPGGGTLPIAGYALGILYNSVDEVSTHSTKDLILSFV